LDQSLKEAVSHGKPVNKETFRTLLQQFRPANNVTEKEVDLLFDVFDRIKDGNLTASDMQETARYRKEKSY
jgi:Ca2+-binding EF-hand superfamily protein